MAAAVPIELPTPRLPDYQTLLSPLSRLNPKRWYYAAARTTMRTIGRASDGIAIGLKHGFDSGVMLEHVYRNIASGRHALGRLIDRVYLNAPGWSGIRERGAILQGVLSVEIDAIADTRRPVTLLDVACGGGRYDLEVLARKPHVAIDATLRDYKSENVASARTLAAELGVATRVERGDAFSDADLAAAAKPNLIVVSGLHEIIPDNAVIERHFKQLAAIAARPATLIFTIQPWHPQLEFIARVLTSHTGAPWVMRIRSWRQTREWVEAAGFRIRSLTMDKRSIFGVVVADLA